MNAEAPLPPTIQMIPHTRISPSPLNPRKTFDEAKIAELADSIVEKGVLQNLVVRPVTSNDVRILVDGEPADGVAYYEIAAGESRWRAVAKAIEDGRLPADFALPCRVEILDDRALLELALTENVQRKELTPIEEAEAFARLVAMNVGTDEIARRIGCSRRHVQLRLDLIERLHPEAQKALREEKITLAQARALTLGPQHRQLQVLEDILEGDPFLERAEDVKEAVVTAMIPVGKQMFDARDYTGEIVDDPDDPERRYFGDTAQAEKLQRAAIAARKVELEKKWAWVEVKRNKYGTNLPYDWRTGSTDKKKAGAVIVINPETHEWQIHEGVLKPAPVHHGNRAEGKPKEPEYTLQFLEHITDIKTRALQFAMLGDPLTAFRLVVLHAIDSDASELHFYRAPNEGDHPAVVEAWKKLNLPKSDGDAGANWAWIKKLNGTELKRALTVAAARAVFAARERWNDVGDDAGTIALAKILGADCAKVWEFYGRQADDFLKACGPKQLERIAQDLGLDATGDAATLRGRIAKVVAEHRKYLPPWLRFGTKAEIEAKATKAAAKPDRAPVAKKPAAKPKSKAKRKGK